MQELYSVRAKQLAAYIMGRKYLGAQTEKGNCRDRMMEPPHQRKLPPTNHLSRQDVSQVSGG